MKAICLFILLGAPLITLGASLAKDLKSENSWPKIAASFVYTATVYTVYYFAGVFTLIDTN